MTKEIIVTDRHGNKKKKIINVISASDMINIKNMPLKPEQSKGGLFKNFKDRKLRSGSPGVR